MSKSQKADGRPSFQFYPDDWLADLALGQCSIAAQGLWMHMLCRMWTSPRRGCLLCANGSRAEAKHIARWAGISEAEAKQLTSELEAEGACSTDENGVIYSRRMVRDEKQRLSKVEAGRRGGMASRSQAEPQAKRGPSTPTPTPTPIQKQHAAVAAEFERAWAGYPNKRGRAKAAELCAKIVKGGSASWEDLRRAVDNYAADCKARQTESRYILHGSTFFGPQGRWQDYLNGIPAVVSFAPRSEKSTDDADRVAEDRAKAQKRQFLIDKLRVARERGTDADVDAVFKEAKQWSIDLGPDF